MRNYIDEIKTLPLFTGIKHEDLEPMLTCLGSYLKTYKKGQFVSLAEEPLKCCLLYTSQLLQTARQRCG